MYVSNRIGIVNIYGMIHGPCLHKIPVGLNCHLLSISNNPFIDRAYPGAHMQSSFVVLRLSDGRTELLRLGEMVSGPKTEEIDSEFADCSLSINKEEYAIKKIIKEYLSTLSDMKSSGKFDSNMFARIIEALESSLLNAITSVTSLEVFEEVLNVIDKQEILESVSFSCEFHRRVHKVALGYLNSEQQLATSLPDRTGHLTRLLKTIKFREESLGIYESLRVIWNDLELNFSVSFHTQKYYV